MKIAIITAGRFYTFDLAKALIKCGHDVKLFTNYPKWAVSRFGLDPSIVASYWPHGVVSRLSWQLRQSVGLPYPEPWLCKSFGSWAANNIMKESWDVINTWSGFSEEILSASKNTGALRLLTRGSSHIRTQSRLLNDEEKRCRIKINKPSAWMVEREEREYDQADYIIVLSKFAYNSFTSEGVDKNKLLILPPAVSLEEFRPSRKTIEARCKRILSPSPLRVLYAGALSFQKGLWDLKNIADSLKNENIRFFIAGPHLRESEKFIKSFPKTAEFIPKQDQHRLPRLYAEADIFIYPTIQDGFAVVLTQARASGLPAIASANSAGPEIISEGKTGWVLPARRAEAFIEKLRWCDAHRKELAGMVIGMYDNHESRNWPAAAQEFTDTCINLKEKSG